MLTLKNNICWDCKLKMLNSFSSRLTWNSWLMHRLMILQYNTNSRPSLLVAFCVGPLVLTKENTHSIFYKRESVCRRGTVVLAFIFILFEYCFDRRNRVQCFIHFFLFIFLPIKIRKCCSWNSSRECEIINSRATRIANFLCLLPTMVICRFWNFPQKSLPIFSKTKMPSMPINLKKQIEVKLGTSMATFSAILSCDVM